MSTEVTLSVNGVDVKALFNNSKTAQDVLSKLPYTVKLSRYEFDYCGLIDSPLAFDEADKHNGWKNGDICLAGPYFTILFDGEEQSASHTGLVKMGEVTGDLSVIRNLSDSVELTVKQA